MVGSRLPGPQPVEEAVASERGRRSMPPGSGLTGQSARRIVTTATSGTRIPSCGFTSAAMTVKIGGALGLVAPQRAQGEQDEDDADRVDLTPDDVVEPEDRVDDHDRGAEQGEPLPTAELADHRPDEVADREVGEDRRDLDEVADATQRVPDGADEPQDVQVSGRVVVEEVALVEAVEPVAGEVVRPELERAQVGVEPGPGEEICQNETEGEAEREDDQDRAKGPLHPGRPRRRSRASLVPTGYGASHRGTAPARAWKVNLSVAQGNPDDPLAGRRTGLADGSAARHRRRGPARDRRARHLPRHPDRPLLRPFRVAGVRLPRGAGGHPLSRSGVRDELRQCILPRRVAGRLE